MEAFRNGKLYLSRRHIGSIERITAFNLLSNEEMQRIQRLNQKYSKIEIILKEV